MPATDLDTRPLIAHVVYHFDIGGLENGVVNLINGLHGFRHAVIAMCGVTDFRRRVQREDVQFFALDKGPGQGLLLVPRMALLLRRLQPAVVHTRNLAALEMLPAALWAGAPVRVHGEHGWNAADPDGSRLRYRLVRRCYRPFVHHYVAVSRQIQRYLVDAIGVPANRVDHLCNGVDTARFRPAGTDQAPLARSPFSSPALWRVGTVGRLDAVKDQVLLARAFARALELDPMARDSMRLMIAGDGPMRAQIEQVLRACGVEPLAWLAGARSDVPDFLRSLDAFVLPSRAEGISNTILEAMATGLPIVATAVGGNVEMIEDGVTGTLVPAGDVDTMAQALLRQWRDRDAAARRGSAARLAAEQRFSLDAMVAGYAALYHRLLARRAAAGAVAGQRA